MESNKILVDGRASGADPSPADVKQIALRRKYQTVACSVITYWHYFGLSWRNESLTFQWFCNRYSKMFLKFNSGLINLVLFLDTHVYIRRTWLDSNSTWTGFVVQQKIPWIWNLIRLKVCSNLKTHSITTILLFYRMFLLIAYSLTQSLYQCAFDVNLIFITESARI